MLHTYILLGTVFRVVSLYGLLERTSRRTKSHPRMQQYSYSLPQQYNFSNDTAE